MMISSLSQSTAPFKAGIRFGIYCVRHCSVQSLEFEAVKVNVVRKFLPCAESTSPFDDLPKSSKASISDALQAIEERQEQRKKSGIFAIEGTRCLHGFPRAFVQLPIHDVEGFADTRPNMQHKRMAVQSGMVRLSCPLLTQAIDQFEYEGTGIKALNESLNELADQEAVSTDIVDPVDMPRTHNSQPKLTTGTFTESTKKLREHYEQINTHWKEIKNALITDEQRVMLKEKLGEDKAEHFLSSGIGGISQGNVNDVKCLHLHTADALLRGKEANKFGAWTLDQLEKERGVNVDGCKDCWQQCDRNFTRTADSWWYTSVKNKASLHATQQRRSEQIAQERAKSATLE